MRFINRKNETAQTVAILLMILSLGAILLQIWILMSLAEAFLSGHAGRMGPWVILSGVGFLVCALTAWTTTFTYFKED